MNKGFTLIELLIVVAIIGILAAIAVPNFLNAQIKAKVARSESELRALGTALEMYRVDNNMYPPTPNTDGSLRLARLAKLTSPIAYMSSVPLDPFRQGLNPSDYGNIFQPEDSAYPLWDPENADNNRRNGNFRLVPQLESQYGTFLLHGSAPDTDYEAAEGQPLHLYDASNGVISSGDLYRTSG